MKNYICVIVYFAVVTFNFDALANHFYLKGGYNLVGNYSDSFKSEYMGYKRFNIDINTAAGYQLSNNFFYEVKVRYANIKPAIQKLEYFEKIDLIDILQRIIDKKVYISKIEDIFKINSVTTLINCGYDYVINNKLIVYLSYGVGIAGLLNYQGFRSNVATHYGMSIQSEVGLCYLYSKKMNLCIGYDYLKNYWKYDTNKIYDEDGNTVVYHFQDFQLNSHTVFVDFKVIL
ncbi:hypothetical protein ECHHL_0599 [Ehrlichia chaffeensis str. Heartland]|uniref:Outer membrane protein beta-barrel domain-containing protein n=1 Tax=Ehrlichia chaffeensis (strain ATCC CRL-10679 / Arkansas) TaxID=205920 RepID=Q2GGE8_EHRCR|nr:hypothetical protein [Ehrlichia chaffeensis]ABD45158.1 hypothetical protein ECH_0678 [Ehrlichia chaffeensis str. Arkansas]AHX03752.1 hypothetical protein ECHHL_0599 [Ehrlichia chaffeensis str. Heartland]AHX05524.1 hypothetical protein ECHJAX_0455 [Ehrlichia chaffeensis str. Jax]AHX06515.1 hypothetical protein ECHLIB_0457 [Ehrlichia chaffeensis str. Liberty]AHX07877.1 hypothetical protein ECHOSC_0610 [Ehrlichia chaffeensis str. Osceola]